MLTARRPLACLSLAALALLACGPTASTTPTAPAKTDSKPVTPAPPVTPNTEPAAEPAAEPTPQVPPVDDQTRAAVGQSINAFAIDLHHALAGRPGNLFVSPASIAIAFAMTHAGARGETEQEIARVFHFGTDSKKTREGFAGALADWSASQENLEISVANRLFGEKTVKFEPAFVDLTRTIFGAPLEPTDFKGAPEPARVRINDWVAERTHDKIKDLIPPGGIDPSIRLVLVNAVYFKASWLEAFGEHSTTSTDFHGASGKQTVKMMTRIDTFNVHVDARAHLKVLEMPYHGTFSFIVVLPDSNTGLAAIEKSLTPDVFDGWLTGMTHERVNVKLPRFKIEPGEGLRLSSILKDLGMRTAFDAGTADFTGIAPASNQIVLSEAFHKAFIAVDEKGTEAAAATAIMAKSGGMPSGQPMNFTADHPFLFMIRDRKSGAILFMGRLNDAS